MILDASALLAFLNGEPGSNLVADAIAAGAGACTVNLAETAHKLVRGGMPFGEVVVLIERLPVTIHSADLSLALSAARLQPHTKRFGLSLADCFCLALGERENRPVLTADSIWREVGPLIGVAVRLVR